MSKSAINFSGDNARVRSRTHQSFAKDADVNNIMTKYRKTGVLPVAVSGRQPMFGDFSDIPDLYATLDRINVAKAAFMRLNPMIRARFSNDVGELLSFVQDPANTEEAIKLGLLPASAQSSGAPVSGVPEATANGGEVAS